MKKLLPDLSKYLLVSVFGTLIHYGLMTVLIQQFSATVLPASTAGAITGALIIYLLNYFCTFHSRKKHLESVSRFFLVAALGLVINGLTLKAILGWLGGHYLIAQCLATVAVFGFSFTINRTWTF
ncbi:MAG: GtrA family protein [Desulfuromonadales bacterium]|nr:GtrA family protein [Desulfuromonadales bacterium]